MPKQSIDAMVDGGKASAGPPLGPALGPMKVNIGEIIAAINEKTKDMAGMKVPIKVIIDTDTKAFEIEVGSPPTSSLIKKEINLDKGSGETGTGRVGNLTIDQAKKIARIKFGSDDDSCVSQIKGTGRSMGVSVGEGEVSESEKQAAEDAAKASADAVAEAEKPAEGAAPAEGEAAEGEAADGEAKEGAETGEQAKDGEKKPEEKKEEK